MPSGGKRKVYNSSVVKIVEELYNSGKTQHEVAAVLGYTQKVVWTIMRNHGISTRTAAKREQFGTNNSSWRGEDATYAAFHKRVEVVRGKPHECERCGTDETDSRYEWANLTGNYDDVQDYERMCVSCHRKFDKHKGGDAIADRGKSFLRNRRVLT